jgi:hypothetical protein
VDINEEALFISQLADPTSQQGQGLQVKNKDAVKKYKEVFRAKLLVHNIFERCQTLAAQPVGSDLTQLQQTLDVIDAEITKAALQAETATAAKSFGYPWSPTLAEAEQHVTFWKNCFCSA